jgi:outer membrane protein assembly factor BamE
MNKSNFIHFGATRRLFALTFCASLLIFQSGCIRPYKIDIQQGSVVSRDQVEQVKPGMSRREVRYVLGTPPIADPFHADRWDYVFSMREGKKGEVQQRQFAVLFDQDVVVSIEGATDQFIGIEERYVLEGKVVENGKKKKANVFQRAWNKVKKDEPASSE